MEIAETHITRWSHGNFDAILPIQQPAKVLLEKYDGEHRAGIIHTGRHAGQWLTSKTRGRATPDSSKGFG